ncbi:MAG: SpoIIE family protein phosphatase [Mycobacteriales bacterium]
MTTSATVLPAHGRSASEARRIIEAAVEEAQLTDLVDEALLLVTELVTNAIVHAGTELELLVSTDGPTLRVEVSDRSPGAIPVVRDQPSETREGGRGIFLLDALATEWGTRHFGSGKSVWFQLGPSARAGGRAHREPVTAASRRDIAWLVGLPADLEQQLSSSQLIGELLHRLVEALRLEQGWLVAQSGDDERTWHVAAAHDVGGAELDVEKARRIAMTGSDGRMPEPHAALVLPLRGRSGVFGALVLGGPDVLSADDIAIARLVGDRLSVVLRDDRAQASQLRSRGSLALLAEASEMFAGTLDVQLAVTLAAQLVVPRFAAWSAVCTAYEHSPRLMAVAHGDESRSAALRVALSSAEGQQLAARLVADLVEQRPVLVPAAELPSSLGEDGAGDVLAVPLVARRRLLGLLLVGRAVGTSYAAAGEGNDVGGDFYDVFSMPTGGWGVAIGDVCGKGAEAAAITGMARDVLRLLTRDGIAPPAVLQRLNDVILELGERGRFCTTALGSVIPRGDGLLVRLSSAGHPPPVLVKRGGEVSLVGRSGTVLGVIEDIEVSEDEVTLLPGDALVFYTDGVTERRSATAMFGEDNLLACLRAAAGSSADVLAGRLEQEVHRFGIGASRDDLAVLVVRAKVPRLRDQPAPELRKPVNA